MRRRSFVAVNVVGVVAGVLAIVAAAGQAHAQTYTWTGSVNSNWDTTTTNWSGAGTRWVNSATSDAVLAGTGGVISPQIDVQINNLSLTASSGTTTINSFLALTFDGVGSGVSVAAGGTLRIEASVMGTVGLTKTGDGTLTLSRWCGFSGPVTISGGNLDLDWWSDNAIPTTADVQIAFGAALRLYRSQEIGALTGSGSVSAPSGSATLSVFGTGAVGGATFSGELQPLAGNLSLRKYGSGTQVLTGDSFSFLGTTAIQQGTLTTSADNALGSSLVTVSPGGTWGVQGSRTLANDASLAGTGAEGRWGAIDNISGNNSLNGVVTLVGNARIGATAGMLTFASAINCGSFAATFYPASGSTIRVPTLNASSAVTKIGTGELVLTGPVGAMGGGLAINAGRVSVGDANALSGVAVTMAAVGATELNLNGSAPQIRSLNGGNASSVVTNSVGGANSARLLTINVPSGTATYAGVIADGASSGTRLEKRGAGEQVLTANQTYSGYTTVAEGTLTASGSLTGVSITINGGTLDGNGSLNATITMISGVLSGTRTISQAVFVAGGTVKPAGAGLGAMTIQGGVSFTGGALEIRDPTVGVGGDRIVVTSGSVSLGAGVATLTLMRDAITTYTLSTRLVIIANNGVGSTSGYFAGLPDGAEVFALSGYGQQDHWYVYYNADIASGALSGGNDVVVTPQAPPTILNGGFEQGSALGVLAPFSHNINNWEIRYSGSVDWTVSWQAAEGTHSVDLQGVNAVGGVVQYVGLTAGRRYRMTFALAGNPDNAPTIKHMAVGINSVPRNYTFDITGKTRTSMGWQDRSFVFVGAAGNTRVEFYSTDPASSWGAVVDNVRLVAATCAGDIAGLGGAPGADAAITVDDLVYFLNRFFAGDANVADIVTIGGAIGSDGQITVDDLIAYLAAFFAGCP